MGAVKSFSAALAGGEDPSEAINAALAAAEAFSGDARLSPRDAGRLAVIVEELVSNVLRHGAQGHAIALELELAATADGTAIVLVDDGIAFDPTAPRAFAGPDAETGGGVGLALIRSWALRLGYRREGARNRLELVLAPA